MKRAKLFRGITLALAFLLGVGSITTVINMNRDNSAVKAEAAVGAKLTVADMYNHWNYEGSYQDYKHYEWSPFEWDIKGWCDKEYGDITTTMIKYGRQSTRNSYLAIDYLGDYDKISSFSFSCSNISVTSGDVTLEITGNYVSGGKIGETTLIQNGTKLRTSYTVSFTPQAWPIGRIRMIIGSSAQGVEIRIDNPVFTFGSLENTVTLNRNGGTGGTGSVKATNGNAMPSITPPTRTGYTFNGYYTATSGGTKYYNSNGSSARNWDKDADTTLYAQWSPKTYTITYKDQGGGNFSGTHASGYPTTHTYASNTNLKNATKTGYTFGGWFTNSACTGNPITVLGATSYTANITLYAKWTGNVYHITFDFHGGESGDESTNATFGSDMPSVTPPTRDKYTFVGYFDAVSGGTKYYDEHGDSARTWNKPSDTLLHAQWTINIDIVLSMSDGFTGVWDGNKYWVIVTPYDAVTEEALDLMETTIYYGESEDDISDTDLEHFKYDAAGTYTVWYKVVKEGYTTTIGSKTFTIDKAPSIIDPRPTIVSGLEYTSLDQELIVEGDVDYGDMLYAVSNDGTVVPDDSEFHTTIPTGNLVGDYYVFYKSSGDSNHYPYDVVLEDALMIHIARVDRTAAENLNIVVEDYLDTLDERFQTIHDDLETTRATFEAEAITEDNITAEGVANKVIDMQANLSAAKVAVTEQLINAIGTVVYPDSKDAMLEALNYYTNVLNDNEKAMVNAELKALLDHDIDLYDTVDGIAIIIKNLPSPAQSKNYYDAVDNAKAAYDALNEEETLTLQNATDFDYEKKLLDNVAAREVIELIDDIDDVTYNGGVNDSKATIEAAEEGYANLTSDQKALIVNINTLTHDREVYDNVHNSVQLIEAIGKVAHTDESKAKIDAARSAYDKLTEEEKALVNGYKETYKTLDDAEHVYQAMVYIDDIGNPAYDTDPE